MAAAVRAAKNKQIREQIAAKKAAATPQSAASARQRHRSDEGDSELSYLERRSHTSPPTLAGSVRDGGNGRSTPAVPAPAAVTVLTGEEPPPPSGFWKHQTRVRAIYTDVNVQWFVAGLIILNFLVNVTEKEIDPSGLKYKSTWRVLEHTFNAIFLVELLVNMYSCWCRPFWSSSWNVFDFVVVCVGCVSFFMELKGPLKLMRTLRAFRVFRLFKRIKSLNMIIVMIVSAIPGVSNAFLVTARSLPTCSHLQAHVHACMRTRACAHVHAHMCTHVPPLTCVARAWHVHCACAWQVMVLSLSIYSLIAVEFFFEFGVANGTALGEGLDAAAVPCGYVNVRTAEPMSH